MKPADFPKEVQPYLIPEPGGNLSYRCLGCDRTHDIHQLLYTCPDCGQVLLIKDLMFDRLKEIPGEKWRMIFDYRRMLKVPALKGIYRYHEFIGPMIPLDAIVYLGEGHTPIVEANQRLQDEVGMRFFYKNDGQNPSASFKDRGMASALSYINYLIRQGSLSNVLAVCASTGDTSAAAALYSAYLNPRIKSAVILPRGKVTPQQLSQPLGSGAKVFEIPGVFDDCMKVVEALSEKYPVALLNSKNAWRILGQESYAFEISQEFEYETGKLVVVLPIGNAGNITAVMSGFIKFYQTGIIDRLPKIIGVQSEHANPVFNYYQQADTHKRKFEPVSVRASVAQAAMIGNPVSMPRVIQQVDLYNRLAGMERVFFTAVTEQDIMDKQLQVNRNGHIACTHGGESLAGLMVAMAGGIVSGAETAILDSTAHALKFSGFQELYFDDRFPAEYEITPNANYINKPVSVHPDHLDFTPQTGKPLKGAEFDTFVAQVSTYIADYLQIRTGEPDDYA
ncbi:MAG: threonine synthase [Desulfobacteraceae bacterium]|nr:threonine synthase [Desulfobacteraceae bacterium]